ncbi:MAG TPA: NAD(P)-dependent oxidoreductase [Jatrophihabitantaceae bacterium]|jgi:uronate dehydrogenase
MPRVLLTGAAGGVGRFLRDGLPGLGWDLRLFDRAPIPEAPDAVVADLRDDAALDAALDGVDAVVHLAGISVEAPFDDILGSNIDGTYRLFAAARRAGVTRIVYASSNHVVGFEPVGVLARVDTPPRPDSYYGLSKAFGEGLGRLYHDRFGLDVVCIRIGSCFERPTSRRQLATWLSPRDAVGLFDACLRALAPGYVVTFGISANTRGWFDIEPARKLGYEPQDDSEPYAAEILAGPPGSDADARYLGGHFTEVPLGEHMR